MPWLLRFIIGNRSLQKKEDVSLTKATASPKAWAVLAGMVLIQAGMMGVIINCTGIVFSAVLEDCGFRAGDLSVYYTIRSLASAAAVGVTSGCFSDTAARPSWPLWAPSWPCPSAAYTFLTACGSGICPAPLQASA